MSTDQTPGAGPEDVALAEEEESRAPSRVTQLVVALCVLALGLVVVWQATVIPGEGWNPRGPRLVPLLVGLIWSGLAVVFVVQAVVGLARGHDIPRAEALTNAPRVGLLLVLIVAYAFALEPLGYVITTVLFFPLACVVLGSRQYVRDFVIGLGMALVLYYSFTELLRIHLPSGVLP